MLVAREEQSQGAAACVKWLDSFLTRGQKWCIFNILVANAAGCQSHELSQTYTSASGHKVLNNHRIDHVLTLLLISSTFHVAA